MEEEEDRLLLNSLGVTSANPEDIERDILKEVSLSLSLKGPSWDFIWHYYQIVS